MARGTNGMVRRLRRTLVGAAVGALVLGLVPFGAADVALAANEDANLEVSPDVSTGSGVGHQYTLTAGLFDDFSTFVTPMVATDPVEVRFEIESGPADSDGATRDSPDLKCTIGKDAHFCTVQVGSNSPGTSIVRAWMHNQAGAPDTTEGRVSDPFRDCNQDFQGHFENQEPPNRDCPPPPTPGATEEMDHTDVVELTWHAGAAKLDCDGVRSTVDGEPAKPGQAATYRCRVTDEKGNPVGGKGLDGENMAGANDPDNAGPSSASNTKPDYDTHGGDPGVNPGNPPGSGPPAPPASFCTTASDGTCTASIPGAENELGVADVCIWVDNVLSADSLDRVYNSAGAEKDGGQCVAEPVDEAEANDLTDKVRVSWENPDPAKGGVDAQAETASAEPGANQSITATVYDQFGDKFVGNVTVRFEFFSGSPNDADGNTPDSPDRTCATAGKDSCTVTYSQADAGTDLVCVFTNAAPAMTGDKGNGTCDGEGLLDASANDGIPVPNTDDQDVVRRVWGGGAGIGYWLVASDGGVFSFGGAKFHGSTGNIKLNRPIVGMAAIFTGNGYWLVASDGGVFSFGDSKFFGSTGNITLNQPIVGMAPTPSGQGYWLVASDGGIFAFGDAVFFGSTGNIKLNQPIVGMATTPTGKGYWLVARDGGVFSFGDAKFFGSTGNIKLAQPVVGMASTPTGNGYWFVAADGGVFAFGDGKFHGSTGNVKLVQPVVGMGATPSGQGYWLVASDGGIFAFGDARFFGSTGNIKLVQPVVGMAPAPVQ